MKDSDFKLKAEFSSYEEVKEAVEVYESQNFCKLYRRRSRSIEAQLKRSPNRLFNELLKFTELELHCVHGGRNHNSRSLGIRRIQP